MSKQEDFLRSPQAAQFLKNEAQVRQLLHSSDVQNLMRLLQQDGADLQSAAAAARKGDATALLQMVEQVMRSPDGAKTVENINHSINR